MEMIHPHDLLVLKLIASLNAVLVTALTGLLIYVWRNHQRATNDIRACVNKLVETQAACQKELPKEFVSTAAYKAAVAKIFERQDELRETLPREYARQAEFDRLMTVWAELGRDLKDRINNLDGRITLLAQGHKA